MAEAPIQGLWVGRRLSAMERISIASFIREGHEYHLYTYGPVECVPPGAKVKECSDVNAPDALIR